MIRGGFYEQLCIQYLSVPDVVLDAVHGRRTEDSDDSAETGRRKKRFAGVGIVRPVDKKR